MDILGETKSSTSSNLANVANESGGRKRKKTCPDCAQRGITSRIKLYQINYEEAVYLCDDETCLFPLTCDPSSLIIKKNYLDVRFRRKPRKARCPPRATPVGAANPGVVPNFGIDLDRLLDAGEVAGSSGEIRDSDVADLAAMLDGLASSAVDDVWPFDPPSAATSETTLPECRTAVADVPVAFASEVVSAPRPDLVASSSTTSTCDEAPKNGERCPLASSPDCSRLSSSLSDCSKPKSSSQECSKPRSPLQDLSKRLSSSLDCSKSLSPSPDLSNSLIHMSDSSDPQLSSENCLQPPSSSPDCSKLQSPSQDVSKRLPSSLDCSTVPSRSPDSSSPLLRMPDISNPRPSSQPLSSSSDCSKPQDFSKQPSSSPVRSNPPTLSPACPDPQSSSHDNLQPLSSSSDCSNPHLSSPDCSNPQSPSHDSTPDFLQRQSSSPDFSKQPSFSSACPNSQDRLPPPSTSLDCSKPPSSLQDCTKQPSSLPDCSNSLAHPPGRSRLLSSLPDVSNPQSSPPSVDPRGPTSDGSPFAALKGGSKRSLGSDASIPSPSKRISVENTEAHPWETEACASSGVPSVAPGSRNPPPKGRKPRGRKPRPSAAKTDDANVLAQIPNLANLITKHLTSNGGSGDCPNLNIQLVTDKSIVKQLQCGSGIQPIGSNGISTQGNRQFFVFSVDKKTAASQEGVILLPLSSPSSAADEEETTTKNTKVQAAKQRRQSAARGRPQKQPPKDEAVGGDGRKRPPPRRQESSNSSADVGGSLLPDLWSILEPRTRQRVPKPRSSVKTGQPKKPPIKRSKSEAGGEQKRPEEAITRVSRWLENQQTATRQFPGYQPKYSQKKVDDVPAAAGCLSDDSGIQSPLSGQSEGSSVSRPPHRWP